MSDVELLFLVLAVVYSWECACWIPRGSVAFRTWFCQRWRPAHPGSMLGNQSGGFIFAHPLPPLGNLLIGTQLPLSLSPNGVLGFVASSVNPGWRPSQTGIFFRFEDIVAIDARGKKVRVNGNVLVKAATPRLASRLVAQLLEIKNLPAGKRANAIEKLIENCIDPKEIER